MPFKCTNCKKEFGTKQRLDTHINKKNKCKYIEGKIEDSISNNVIPINKFTFIFFIDMRI